MAITLYRKDTGEAVIFAHTIDAKESMAGGFYSTSPPPKKEELPEKSEAKPIVIPTAKDKKPSPIVKEVEPVVEKEKEEVKPVVKTSPKIIRK